MKNLKRACITYISSSIFIQPGIVVYALGRGRYGFDCSDLTWDTISESAKASYYNEAALIMMVVSGSMLILGTALMCLLLKYRSHRTVAIGLFMMLAFAGYAFIIISSGAWSC